MHRLTVWVAARPWLAAILAVAVAVIVAACKGGGSSGY
jgi:uncharacterized membrane protein YdfJ with MMPL/SSD domain